MLGSLQDEFQWQRQLYILHAEMQWCAQEIIRRSLRGILQDDNLRESWIQENQEMKKMSMDW